MKHTIPCVLILFILISLAIPVFGQTRYESEIFSSYQLQSNIQYGATTTQKMDIYTGTGDYGTSRPLVIFIHGGGFKGGDKVSNFGTLVCGGLAKRGYVVASINYRITSTIPDDQTHFEAMLRALQDAKAAVRFFRRYHTTYGIDTTQIFATGSSAGSITALHLAFLDSVEVPSFVNWANVGGTFEGSSGNPGYTSNIQGVISNWGAIGDTLWMQNGDVPVYCVHGLDDVTVYYEQIPADGPFLYGSKHIFDRAQNIGLISGLRTFVNTGHTLDNNTTKQDSAYKDFSAWLYTILEPVAIGSPAKLAFDIQPSNAVADNIIAPPIKVQIQDSAGYLISNDTRLVTVGIGNNAGPGGILGGTTTVAAVAGIATFNDLSIDKAGVGYTLVATASTITEVTSSPFTIISGSVTGSITSTGSGNWSSTTPDAPWPSGIVPTSSDAVTIADGSTVTIDAAAACASLTVGQGTSGILQFEETTARTLTVVNDVTIRQGGIFSTSSSGSVVTHSLSVGGNLINNGSLDFSTNSNSAGASITFTGSSNVTFGGSGSVTNIRSLTLNKGNSSSSILDLNPTMLTVQGSITDGTAMGFLTILNGTMKISGTFTMTARVFTSATYTIPSTGGFWLNNPNFTVAGQAGNSICDGLLRISQGTYNIGTNSSNKMTPTTGSVSAVFMFEGGTTNISGMLRAGSSTNVSLTVTGGTINVTTVGNAGNGEPGFGFTSTSNVVTISGGTINLVQRNKYSVATSRRDYNVLGGLVTITGGTLNVGTSATATNFDFAIGGNIPNLVIDNTGTAKTARLSGSADVYGDVTMNTGTTLDLNGKDGCSVLGNAATPGIILNNGSIIGATGSRFKFAGVNGQQAYVGTGTLGTDIMPFEGVTFNNSDGVALNSPVVTYRVNLYKGEVTNANLITLGNGGTSTVTIQRGNDVSVVAGMFDSTPIFQIGSGGYTLLYGGSLTTTPTGYEIPAGRSVNRLSVGSPNGIALMGGDLTVADSLFMNSGNIITGSSTVILGASGVLSYLSGYINGYLQKPIGSGTAISQTFEIGDSLGYTPVIVTFTNVSSNGTLTASTVAGNHPQLATSGVDSTRKVNRYYTLANDGIVFDQYNAVFQFLRADISPGADTSLFVVRQYENSTWFSQSTIKLADTLFEGSGLTSFGDFLIGQVPQLSLNLTVSGNGSVTKSPDQLIYLLKTPVTLSAYADAGWHFKEWSGDITGQTNPYELTMDGDKNITAVFEQDMVTFIVSKGWNMVSLPVTVPDHKIAAIFPSTISGTFRYQTGYGAVDTLENMQGYWTKFADTETLSIVGPYRFCDSVSVNAGWNMIGTISQPLAVSEVVPSNPGMIGSSFFGFEAGYAPADSLQPGKAYWIKVTSPGTLFLCTPGNRFTCDRDRREREWK